MVFSAVSMSYASEAAPEALPDSTQAAEDVSLSTDAEEEPPAKDASGDEAKDSGSDIQDKAPETEKPEEEAVPEEDAEEAAPSEEEKKERTFTFENEEVIITATETKEDIFPEKVTFECEKIDEKSDDYLKLRQKIGALYGLDGDRFEILPYDVRFIADGKEVEPKDGSVGIHFEFKDPIKVSKKEDVSVVHMEGGKKPEVVAEDVATGTKVEEFDITLDNLSPVVLTRTNIKSSPLKSVQLTDDEGDYWISKTPNINNSGVASSLYSHNANTTDEIDAGGALYLDVEVRYGGESIGCDWLYIKDADDNIITQDADGKTVGSTSSNSLGKIGGSGSNFSSSASNTYTHNSANTVHYRFETDTLKFVWRTDGSVAGYGYYAIIRPTFPEGEVPAYHLEELEDGTYALVFDRGGDINGFINLPSVKEAIGDQKSQISEIRLHKDTTAIKSGAFSGMSGLKKVTMPRNSQLETIGKNVFRNCDSLESIDIPATVTSVASSAFSGCTGLETVKFAEANTITELPEGLFKDLTSLKSVDLPQGLTKVPDELFSGCTSLKSVTLPESVTEIGESAFKNSGLTHMPSLENITSIGASSFSGCRGITEVSIPANVTSIGTRAFEKCSGVTDFTFEDGTSFPTLPTYMFSEMTNLKNVKLPSDLTRIPNYCFYNCSKLQKVDIPDTCTRIGDYAFSGCSNLKDFEIPSQVTTLGPYAFRNCTSLKDMEIPATVTSVGSGLFYGCSNLIKMKFEEGSPVTTLPNDMFNGCTRLETVKLPDGVRSIPASYFRDCTSLKHVDLPENLTSIGNYAFYNCYNLENIELSNTLTSIGQYAFYNCDGITDVTIPKSVTSIGQYAWQNCNNIKTVEWEEGSPMTSLNTYLFSGCSSLESVVLPSRLTSVPNGIFSSCTRLSHVDIPDTVTTIGSSAFDNCTSLQEIDLPERLTAIYSYAFRNTGLTDIDFPANLGSIGDYAFEGTKLTEVTIPNNVTSVGSYAFRSISPLESVTFEDGGKNCSIGSYAFSSNAALKNVDLKEKITSIGQYAFNNDRRIEEITIPSTVTSIGNYAFNGAKNLKKLEFPASATNAKLSLGSSSTGYTFGRLSNVEEVFIDRDITSGYTSTTHFYDFVDGVKFTIGRNVNSLDNIIISLFSDDDEIVFEGENDFSVTTKIANSTEDSKWQALSGKFYVDPSGVLYKLNDSDNTASVFHIPAGLDSYTVPETVTSVAGKTYTVNKIESYAVRDADDLTSLTVETPANVKLPQFSLGSCPTLLTVNGQAEIFPEEWADVSLLCGFPVHSDQQTQQVLSIRDSTVMGEPEQGQEPPRFSFGVTVSGQESMADDNLTYVFPTGMSARLDFAVSNESNFDMSTRVIRIYFAFDGDNYTMGNYQPGQTYTLVNTSTNSRYPFKVGTTDAKGVYYYDITGFKPGDTLGFNNNFAYLSPKSAGGTMRVWAESLTAEEAAQMEGKVSQPKDYILAEWYTKPTPYNVTKAVNGNPTFQFVSNSSDENDDNIYVRNVSYRIDMTSQGSSGSNYAKDYIKYADFSDDIQLTENMIWSPDIIEAIRNKNYYVNSSNYLYAKIDGKWVEVCHVNFPSTDMVRSFDPEIVTDSNGNDAVRLVWSYKNTYWTDTKTAPTAEMPATAYYVYIGEHALQVKRDSDLWKKLRDGEEYTAEEYDAMRKISNKVTETSHYSFSEDQVNTAEAAQRLIYETSGFSMTKAMTGYMTFGREHGYTISLINSGLINKTDIDIVEDALHTHYYIEGDDMEEMFRNNKWGPYLKIDITSATLCTIPDRTAVDVQGHEIDSFTAQQSGIDPIPYNGRAAAGTDASEETTSAKLSFHWDAERSHIVMDVKNDAGTVLYSKTIGSDGDYGTIKEALDDIGYVVTYRAAYKVTWDLGDDYTLYNAKKDGAEAGSIEDLTPEQIAAYEYKLKSGRTDKFDIQSRIKKATMMLTEDRTGYYTNSSIYSNNTAYAKTSDGTNVGQATWSGYIYNDLSLSKSAVANGTSYTSSMSIPDNTVVDYRLQFTNSGETYDVLPLTDRMTGAQMLLVPVRGNRNALYYAAGAAEGIALSEADLDVYSDEGISYYVLDKAGTYKGVTIDGRLADTISVTKNPGNVDTLMTWYYQDVTGANSNTSSVTRSVVYKALADSSRAGANASDQSGSTVTANALGNQSWLGGHQTHRLYAALNGQSEQIQFNKRIVEDPEAAEENLIGHSLIKNGDEVLYKITLKNTGDGEVTLKGNRIHDELPSTKGIFAWSKANVKEIYYVTRDAEVETQSADYWYVNSTQPNTGADTASRGLYYIYWNNDFEAHFDSKGELDIYVKLEYPGDGKTLNGDVWDDFIAANGGAVLTNYFYVGQKESHVTHELVDFTEGILQKGVLDTGLAGSSYNYQSESTRNFYQNGGNVDNGSVQEVAYYTVVYNSGNVRLYLDPLQDQLPKGFKFRGLINYIPKAAETSPGFNANYSTWSYNSLGSYYNNFSTIYYLENRTGNSSSIPVATVRDGEKNVVYKNAQLTAVASDGSDGRQQVEFRFSRYSNNDSYLKYDSSLQKYYLDPGEAVRFGYICTVEGYARTENIANNEISMPVYDKYGLGVNVSDEDVAIIPAAYRDISNNDGECDKKTTEEEVSGYGHTKPAWARSTTDWFSSNVSLRRLAAVPGVLKSVGGETFIPTSTVIQPDQVYGSKYTDGSKGGTPYVGTVARTSIVNWQIKAYNEGGAGSNSMEDFWIEDTVDAPYMFTGNYFYDYYSVNGTKMTSSSVPVFSLGGRRENDELVKISTGQGANALVLDSTIRVNGDPVEVDGGRATVQLLRNVITKTETLRIRFKDNYHRIPPNSYMSLYAHTQYVSSDAVLSKQFYNHVELQPTTDFDPALVSQGKVLYREFLGEQEPYAIESGASVTMTAGYSSAARKQVTQLDNASNTGWSDREQNSIELPEKFSKFRYDLYVDLPKDDPTKRLVLIDSLPEPGDHSPFVDRDLRDSQFVVHMPSENLGLDVWTAANAGTGAKTLLSKSDYTFEVNTKTEFDTDDWDGNGSGWHVINFSDGLSDEETALIENARSFRVILDDPDLIEDPDNALMGKNCQVQIRFNAELQSPEDADPGSIAWNSFGYRYTVPIGATGISTSLNAEPLKVGVKIPSVPFINKDLKTPNDHYRKAEEDSEYRFLIYSGSALASLNDISEMSMSDIAGILSANSREVLITRINIASGSATGKTDYLDEEKKWVYDADEEDFVPTADNWIWNNNAKYTIIELPWAENGYSFSDIQHSPVNNYTFTQYTTNNISLRVTNVWSKTGGLELSKTAQGPSFDPDRKFTFTIHLQDGRYPVYGTFDYVGTNIRDGSLTFNDAGDASIQLKHGQKIELQGIPSGYTYSVTEAADPLYTSAGTGTEGTIADGSTQTAAFVNTRKDTSLSVSKTVEGGFGDKTKLFDFEIYVIDEGRELSGSYSARITHSDASAENITLTFAEGAAVTQLKHGDTLTVSGLPVGARYEVDELAASRRGYTVTSTNEAGSLTEDPASVTYVNTLPDAVPTGTKATAGLLVATVLGLFAVFFVLRRRKTSASNQ